MLQFNDLEIDNEYYFYFANYYMTGFVISIKDNLMRVRNGHYYYGSELIHAYTEAFIDLNHIISYALT